MAKSKLSVFRQLFLEAFRQAPVKFIGLYGGFALGGVLFGVMVRAKAHLFDAVVDFTQRGETLYYVLCALALLLGLEFFSAMVSAMTNYLAETYDVDMAHVISKRMNEKLGKLPQVDFETPSKLDLIERAKQGAQYAMGFLNSVMDLVFMYAPIFVFMGIYLYLLKPILLLSLIFIFIPVLYTQWVKMKWMGKMDTELAPIRRANAHYSACAGGRKAFKETRVLNAFAYFRNLFAEGIKRSENMQFQVKAHINLWEASARLVSILGYGGILVLLFVTLKEGDITVGTFAAVFYTVDELYRILEEAIVSRFGPMATHYNKLASYYEFLDLPERALNQAGHFNYHDFKALHFKSVHFAYPNGRDTLQNVSFSVNKGESIAIVGVNGAGKSTLTKLISGMLQPTKGEIVWESESGERQLPTFADFTQLFQRYQRYDMTLQENVSLGASNKALSDEALETALNQVGLSVNEPCFIQGKDTLLSKEFGSVDLSGGQWQRLAMARAFYKEAPLVLLDEPTSAIDPIMEASLYKMFHRLMANKTSFVVTHRMGSIQYVDKILVMDQGSIKGFGTHDSLMTSCEAYRCLWSEL